MKMRSSWMWLGACLLFGSGCVIEDREADPTLGQEVQEGDESDAGISAEHEAACEQYCRDAMENCTDEFALYTSAGICESLCRHFPLGDMENPRGNTVACRAHQAQLAGTTDEPAVHCPNAGPGGNQRGNNVGCGSDCEAYCYLHPRLCDGVEGEVALEEEQCLRQCAGLREKPTFDVVADHDSEDSLECRLQHLTSASEAPVEHCWHTALAPRAGSPCDDLPDAEVPCEVYCDLVMAACTDENQMYDSRAQCLQVCAVLPPGVAGDRVEDTVGCRRYHSYNSTVAPTSHCLHAGPTGNGHCGTENCTSFCMILKAACEEAFTSEYLDDATEDDSLGSCPEQCAELEGAPADESDYSVNPEASGDTVGCRTLHAVRALSDAEECAAAMGAAPCD